MKKLLFIIPLIVFSYGCGKKSEVSPTSLIVGKWFITRQIHKVYIGGTLTSTTDTVMPKNQDYSQFNADNTGLVSSSNGIINFTYVLSSSSLSITTPVTNGSSDPNETGHGTYTVNALTSTTLDLYWEQNNIPPNERDTFEVVYSK